MTCRKGRNVGDRAGDGAALAAAEWAALPIGTGGSHRRAWWCSPDGWALASIRSC